MTKMRVAKHITIRVLGMVTTSLLGFALNAVAAPQKVSSPDGKIVFTLNDENTLSYEVAWAGVPVLKRSELSFSVGSDNFCRDVTVATGKSCYEVGQANV